MRELFALNAADGSENMGINDLKELLGHRHNQADNKKHNESFETLWQEFLYDFKVQDKSIITFKQLWEGLPHNHTTHLGQKQ